MKVIDAYSGYKSRKEMDREVLAALLPVRMADRDEVIEKITSADEVDRIMELDLPEKVARTIAAAITLGNRYAIPELKQIRTPEDVFNRLRAYGYKEQEHFILMALDSGHQVISTRVVTIGTSNMTLATPKEILYTALREDATAIVIAHNHPSGVLMVSAEDMAITKRIMQCCQLIGINMLDHIILTQHGYLSMNAKGLLETAKPDADRQNEILKGGARLC